MSPVILQELPPSLWGGNAELALPGSGTSAPPGLEAILSYNGIVIHDRQVVDKYRVLEISGLHSADIRDTREVLPGDDGEVPLESLLGGRTIVLTIRVEAYSVSKLRDMEQALRTAFYSKIERPLRFNTGDARRDVFIMCRMIDKPGETERQNGLNAFRDFQITLRASDPRFYSVNENRSLVSYSSGSTSFERQPNGQVANLVTNPSFELNTTGWRMGTGSYWLNGGGSLGRNTGSFGTQGDWYGYASTPGVSIAEGTENVISGTFTAGITYTASILVYRSTKARNMYFGYASTDSVQLTTDTGAAGWVRHTLTWTPLTTGTTAFLGVRQISQVADTIEIDGAMVNQGGPLTYVEGGMLGYRWEGTAHASRTLSIGLLNQKVFGPVCKGNFLVRPIFRLRDMSNVTIRNEAIMPDEFSTRSLIIEGVIPSDQVYEYDAFQGDIINNLGVSKLGQLSVDSMDIRLAPGENFITLEATSAGSQASVEIIYRETFI